MAEKFAPALTSVAQAAQGFSEFVKKDGFFEAIKKTLTRIADASEKMVATNEQTTRRRQ
jgi:hypothetical protein